MLDGPDAGGRSDDDIFQAGHDVTAALGPTIPMFISVPAAATHLTHCARPWAPRLPVVVMVMSRLRHAKVNTRSHGQLH